MKIDKIDRALIALPVEVRLEYAVKDRVAWRHEREERCARSQFHVVRRSEDLMRRAAIDREHRLGARDETRTEDRMPQIRARFVEAADRVALGRGAQPEPGELRKDVPHPVRSFSAACDFLERTRVIRFLRSYEALQIKSIGSCRRHRHILPSDYTFVDRLIDLSSVIGGVEIVMRWMKTKHCACDEIAQKSVTGRLNAGAHGLLFGSAMTIQRLGPSLAVTILCSALPVAAQDLSPSIRTSAACAPVGSAVSANAPIVLALDTEDRMLYYAGDRISVSAGAEQGLDNGQRFFVRRPLVMDGTPRGEHTAGWIRIVDTRKSSATAVVDFSCDAVAIGDYLEPFGDQALPTDIDRTDATGTLDFSKSATVLFGNDGRQIAGGRDFVLAAIGRTNGVTPGTRYAIYHGLTASREPNVSFGEAVVVHVSADRSLLRITEAHDAVRSGDTLVLRVGVVGLSNDSRWELQQGLLTGGEGEGEGSAPAPRSAETPAVLHSVAFDDVQFDFDKYSLKPENFARLDQAIQVLQQNQALKIRIEGYSCNIGTVKYNLALGKRRANAVRQYLVRHGVAANRLTMVSFGESRPKYDNRKKETQRLNRRAALVVNIER